MGHKVTFGEMGVDPSEKSELCRRFDIAKRPLQQTVENQQLSTSQAHPMRRINPQMGVHFIYLFVCLQLQNCDCSYKKEKNNTKRTQRRIDVRYQNSFAVQEVTCETVAPGRLYVPPRHFNRGPCQLRTIILDELAFCDMRLHQHFTSLANH